MKQVLLFVALVTVMGSLKRPEIINKCPNKELLVKFYEKGELRCTVTDPDGFSLRFPIPESFRVHGKTFLCDSAWIDLR
jgi:hypothetical protein